MEKGNPRFKPGDVVTIRQWDDMRSDFAFMNKSVRPDIIHCPCGYEEEYVDGESPICLFTADMKFLCGTQVRIREAAWLTDYSIYAYRVESGYHDKTKFFTETMFEIEIPELSCDLKQLEDSDLMDFIAQ